MTFTTLTFVLFLPAVFTAYWLLQRRTWQNALIVVSSYFFYGWWDWRFCGLMLVTSVVDYWLGWGMERLDNPRSRKFLLTLSCLLNLGCLGFFKYFNFFAENFQALMTSIGWPQDRVVLQVILPVGISFYTFQSLSYTIDVYRRDLKPAANLTEFLAFVSFFPQLVAGPIERATNLLPQFAVDRHFDHDKAVDGCRQMLWGFFKKIAIADRLAEVVDAAYARPDAMGGHGLLLATVCFALQIYTDFSAYSDIAIGCARLFGFSLMRNFAYPYFSQSVAEFWRRWHISLSTWFRDYLYVPLGGSRCGRWRNALNVFITFIVSGFWHGASWNFVIWGAINGAGAVPSIFRSRRTNRPHPGDTPGGESLVPAPVVVARMAGTFAVIGLSWVFFRAATLGDAATILGRIVHDLVSLPAWRGFFAQLKPGLYLHWPIVATVAGFVALEWVMRRRQHPLQLDEVPWFQWCPRPLRWVGYSTLFWMTLYLSPPAGKGGAFIYFQF